MKFQTQRSIYLIIIIFVLVIATGCSRNTAVLPTEQTAPVFVRTPRPTFTPDPAALAEQPAGIAEELLDSQSAEPTPLSIASDPAKGVINFQLVNVREGPGTEHDLVEIVEEGQEFEIIAKNVAGDWWKICCVPDKAAWVIDDYIDVSGPIDLVPVAPELLPPTPTPTSTAPPTALPTELPALPPTNTPLPINTLSPQRATPTLTAESQPEIESPNDDSSDADINDEYSYTLVEREQFSESGMMRIYLYIYAADTKESLSGYTLRIVQDGKEWPIYSGRSSEGPPAFTWPFQSARQRSYNFKVELPDVSPEGIWSLQLVDEDDNPVGLESIFILEEDEPNRELYVSYTRE